MFASRRKTKSLPQAEDSLARIAIGEDGLIVYASSAFAALAGQDPADIINTDAATLLRFPGAKTAFHNLASGTHAIEFQTNKKTFNFHFDWLAAPDKKRYFIGSEIRGRKKSVTTPAIAARIQDISRAARPGTIETMQDTLQFISMSQDVMAVAGPSGEILRANDIFFRLFGYSEEDLHNLNLADLFNPADKSRLRRTLTKNGAERWMEWREMVKGGLIYCTGRDVTALRRQEKALSRREDQLKEAESIGGMGHWRWQIGGDTIEWSDQIYKIFGVEKKYFKPTLESMNALINRRDIAKVNQAFQRAMIELNDYDMEFRVGSGEKERFIRCEGRCAVNEDGEAVALYGIMQDMTDRLRHEAALKEAKDSAERAYAAKSQFLANMSHELRTPLNAIIGFSEIIQRQMLGPVGSPKYAEYANSILESGHHLLDIISDILDMSKIEAGKYELALESVNITKTINTALHMMEGRARNQQVKISARLALPENTIIVADRRAVLQIMLNLLSNAVKFSKPGGNVHVEAQAEQDEILIQIADEGIGIPANKLAYITRPFEQVSSHYTRDHEGTGLGLAITKELAELHGGELQIESTMGIGTRVSVRLPQKK